jgi:hypothetical protein
MFRRSSTTPTADTLPEEYASVRQAAAQVEQLTATLAAAEQVLRDAEAAYAQAEAQAADAVAEGFEPTTLHDARQAMSTAAERQHLLSIALQRAKARYDGDAMPACWGVAFPWARQIWIRARDDAQGMAYTLAHEVAPVLTRHGHDYIWYCACQDLWRQIFKSHAGFREHVLAYLNQ